MNPYDILKSAQKGKYAIGSFNFSTAEILKAIVLAAKDLNSPIIVSTSEGEAEFIGMREAAALVKAWRAGTKLPIFLNLDHGKSLKSIKKALAASYDMVHFDGSELSCEKNITETKKVADFACDFEKTFDKRVIIEGELGYLRGSSSLHKQKLEIKPEDLTNPERAKEFVEKTGVDSLAIAIGNAHGVFIEGGPALRSLGEGGERLYLDRLAQIKEAVGEKVFLVLHGGSGIPDEDVKKSIESGIAKVNVNTELRVAYKEALDKELKEKSEETTPHKILEPSLEAVKKVVEEKIRLFGSENKIT
ncbi:MAG: class II fructose-bisphosphate aldolase [Candidatus Portnoybacteria bacterium]|nr:class II fructose-bisphosphate aldolase [Candidatus Portnoybacteria bacterium]